MSLYFCIVNNIVFENRAIIMDFMMKKHLKKYLNHEEVEVHFDGESVTLKEKEAYKDKSIKYTDKN